MSSMLPAVILEGSGSHLWMDDIILIIDKYCTANHAEVATDVTLCEQKNIMCL